MVHQDQELTTSAIPCSAVEDQAEGDQSELGERRPVSGKTTRFGASRASSTCNSRRR